MKIGLLGDFSGVCKACNEGTVGLFKKGDSFQWRCNARHCRKYISILHWSFFSGSHLSLKSILVLIHGWVHDASQKYMQLNLRIGSPNTLVDWFNFCRDVCVDIPANHWTTSNISKVRNCASSSSSSSSSVLQGKSTIRSQRLNRNWNTHRTEQTVAVKKLICNILVPEHEKHLQLMKICKVP